MENRLYIGTIRHRRFEPKFHEFTYKVYYLLFAPHNFEAFAKDIKWLSYNKFNLISFFRKNYIGLPSETIEESVQKLLENANIHTNEPVYLLTQLSHLGFCFNPISLYFMLKKNSENIEVESIIADVHNTPWGEKHPYILTNPTLKRPPFYHYDFKKSLHVSPFMDMDYRYKLNLKFNDKNINIHMSNIKNDKASFDASLNLTAFPLTEQSLAKAIFNYPFITQKIIFLIYWQALKLFIKKIPFIPHP